MEWILWTIYLSGAGWVFGWIVMLPLGFAIIFFWLPIDALIKLFSGEGDIGAWFAGPFMRAYVVGPLIFILQIISSAIPVVGAATSFLFGWWANLDYYGYNYELFAGPTLPGSS